jgi:hypothetical protein
MKIKTSDLRKLIKEELFVPEYKVVEISEECADSVKKLLVQYINKKSTSSKERIALTAQANSVIADLKKDLKDKINEKLDVFFNRSSH